MSDVSANDDQFLKKHEGYSTSSLGEFSTISNDDFRTVRLYLQLIWGLRIIDKKKIIPIGEILDNAKVVFDDSILKSKDSLWINKLASTFQELVDGQICANWRNVIKCLPKDPVEYMVIINFKIFFNNVKHFRMEKAALQISEILGDSYKKTNEITEEIFEKISTEFILTLSIFFKKHCQK